MIKDEKRRKGSSVPMSVLTHKNCNTKQRLGLLHRKLKHEEKKTQRGVHKRSQVCKKLHEGLEKRSITMVIALLGKEHARRTMQPEFQRTTSNLSMRAPIIW